MFISKNQNPNLLALLSCSLKTRSSEPTAGVFAIEKLHIHNKKNKLSLENHFLSYNDSKFMRVEVFVAVHLMTRPVFWNATLRRCACASRRSEENHCHHLHGSRFFMDLSILRMKALHSFEKSRTISCNETVSLLTERNKSYGTRAFGAVVTSSRYTRHLL